MRTIISILGIALSIAAITSVLRFILSVNQTLLMRQAKSYGYEDFVVDHVDEDIYKDLLIAPNIGRLSKLKNDKNLVAHYHNNKDYESIINIYIKAVGQDYFDHFFQSRLVKGRLPKSSGEMLLPYDLSEASGIFSNLDSYIQIPSVPRADMERLVEDIYSLEWEQSGAGKAALFAIHDLGLSSYLQSHNVQDSSDYEVVDYKVVGYYDQESVLDYLYFSDDDKDRELTLTYLSGEAFVYKEDVTGQFSVLGLYQNSSLADQTASQIQDLLASHKGKAYFLSNDSILALKNPQLSASAHIYVLISSLIIILWGILLMIFIYNVLSANYSRRLKELGLLKVIGLTDRQLFFMIMIEGLIYFALAIPLGFMISMLAAESNYFWLEKMLSQSVYGLYNEFALASDYRIYIFSGVIGLILVLFSQGFVCYRLFDVSVMSFIQSPIRPASKLNKSKKKPKKKTNIYSYLIWQNVKNNRLSTVMVTASLTITITIFISISYFTNIYRLEEEQSSISDSAVYGQAISHDRQQTKEFIGQVNASKAFKATTENAYLGVSVQNDQGRLFEDNHVLILFDDQIFNDIYPDYKNDDHILLVARENTQVNKAQERLRLRSVLFEFEDEAKDWDNGPWFTSQLMDAKKPVIMKYMQDFALYDNVYLGRYSDAEKIFQGSGYNLNEIITIEKLYDDQTAKDSLKAIFFRYPYIQIVGQEHVVLGIIKFLASNFIAFIVLLSLLHVANAIYYQSNMRKKEYALLQAIGSNPKQIRKLIIAEALIPVFLAAMASAIVSGISLFFLGKFAKSYIMTYTSRPYLPVIYYLFALIVASILVVVASIIPLRKLEKGSLTKILKQEN